MFELRTFYNYFLVIVTDMHAVLHNYLRFVLSLHYRIHNYYVMYKTLLSY